MDYDQWLQQPYVDAAARSAEIQKIVEEVLQEDEFNPLKNEVFCMALSEGVIDDVPDNVLTQALNDPEVGHNKLGTLIYEAVYRWCYKCAENEAAQRYNSRLG